VTTDYADDTDEEIEYGVWQMSLNVIGIGEILWDLLPSGAQLGGAPANFAWHAHQLGAKAQIISRVGKDGLGEEIHQRLAKMELSGALVQTDAVNPTSTVTVAVADGHPEYAIHENVAWDHIAVTDEARAAVNAADAVCFGSLAQRSLVSRKSIQTLVAAARSDAWRIFDINLRQHYFDREVIETSLKLANVFKLNDAELPVVAKLFSAGGDVKTQIEFFANRFGLRVVALTRGAHGSLLFRDGSWSEHGAIKVEVKDTIGAGDSFTAALCLGLLRGMDLDAINAAANRIAAFVCGHAGATPALPDELVRSIL
jgi:fructokinase